MEVLQILVGVVSDAVVDVRWVEPLRRPNSPVYRALAASLEEIDGVESLRMGRYSAELEVATHVATADEVARRVEEELRDPHSEFRTAFRFEFQDVEPDVVNVGRSVRL